MKPYIIGISGGSASGKTFLLDHIRSLFSPDKVCIISQDNYYRPLAEQQSDANGMTNFDLPEGIDEPRFLQDILELRAGQAVETMDYTFNNPAAERKNILLLPAPVIVVEGLFIFYFDAISSLFNYKIFMEAPEEHRLARRLERDKEERGMTEEFILYQWENHVLPGFERYLYPYRASADLIVDNNGPGHKKAFESVARHISQILAMEPGL